jgi:hypothetical protein
LHGSHHASLGRHSFLRFSRNLVGSQRPGIVAAVAVVATIRTRR